MSNVITSDGDVVRDGKEISPEVQDVSSLDGVVRDGNEISPKLQDVSCMDDVVREDNISPELQDVSSMDDVVREGKKISPEQQDESSLDVLDVTMVALVKPPENAVKGERRIPHGEQVVDQKGLADMFQGLEDTLNFNNHGSGGGEDEGEGEGEGEQESGANKTKKSKPEPKTSCDVTDIQFFEVNGKYIRLQNTNTEKCVNLKGCQLIQRSSKNPCDVKYSCFCFTEDVMVPPRGIVTVWSLRGTQKAPQTDFINCKVLCWESNPDHSCTVLSQPEDLTTKFPLSTSCAPDDIKKEYERWMNPPEVTCCGCPLSKPDPPKQTKKCCPEEPCPPPAKKCPPPAKKCPPPAKKCPSEECDDDDDDDDDDECGDACGKECCEEPDSEDNCDDPCACKPPPKNKNKSSKAKSPQKCKKPACEEQKEELQTLDSFAKQRPGLILTVGRACQEEEAEECPQAKSDPCPPADGSCSRKKDKSTDGCKPTSGNFKPESRD